MQIFIYRIVTSSEVYCYVVFFMAEMQEALLISGDSRVYIRDNEALTEAFTIWVKGQSLR